MQGKESLYIFSAMNADETHILLNQFAPNIPV